VKDRLCRQCLLFVSLTLLAMAAISSTPFFITLQ
jgi:hypothetical protein